jgi:hypothetical protein
MRGTERMAHPVGEVVYWGQTRDVQVSIPAFRQEVKR